MVGNPALQHKFSGKSQAELVRGDHVSCGQCLLLALPSTSGLLCSPVASCADAKCSCWHALHPCIRPQPQLLVSRVASCRRGAAAPVVLPLPALRAATARLLTRPRPACCQVLNPHPLPPSHPLLCSPPPPSLQPWSGVAEAILKPLPADWRHNIQQAFSQMGEALGKLLGGGEGQKVRCGLSGVHHSTSRCLLVTVLELVCLRPAGKCVWFKGSTIGMPCSGSGQGGVAWGLPHSAMVANQQRMPPPCSRPADLSRAARLLTSWPT